MTVHQRSCCGEPERPARAREPVAHERVVIPKRPAVAEHEVSDPSVTLYRCPECRRTIGGGEVARIGLACIGVHTLDEHPMRAREPVEFVPASRLAEVEVERDALRAALERAMAVIELYAAKVDGHGDRAVIDGRHWNAASSAAAHWALGEAREALREVDR